MTTRLRAFAPSAHRYGRGALAPPPAWLEAAFYCHLWYSTMAPDFNIVIPMAGLAFLVAMALYAAMGQRSDLLSSTRLIVLPIGCALSFMAVRVLIHGDSISADYVREVPAWICMLIVAQSLCRRPKFIQRFPLVMFAIGLPALRSFGSLDTGLTTDGGIEVIRAGGGMGPLKHPNYMAFWFGFCCVYFAVLGLETRRTWLRAIAWAAGTGCLLAVGMTVSRGTLGAVLIAVVIGFRRLLKRGFVPLVVLAVAGGVVYSLGIFSQAAQFYSARGAEETGRLLVWPVAIQRILESPFFGHVETSAYVPGRERPLTPHNAFIFIAMATGFVPVLFFAGHCIQATTGAWRAYREQLPDALFVLPLFVFTFIVLQTTNAFFLDFIFIVTLASALQVGDELALRFRRHQRQGRYDRGPAGIRVPEPSRAGG